jgi:Spy/CpxP family protein refolding chaperone
MNKNRFARPAAVAAGFVFMWAAPGLTRAQSRPPGPQTPNVASPGAQPQTNSLEVFGGLHYTDDQKKEIDQIHRETKSSRDVVEKTETLTADQKDAMLAGYDRLEYGRIYRVLTPEQRRQVSQRIRARRAAEQVAPKNQSPRN